MRDTLAVRPASGAFCEGMEHCLLRRQKLVYCYVELDKPFLFFAFGKSFAPGFLGQKRVLKALPCLLKVAGALFWLSGQIVEVDIREVLQQFGDPAAPLVRDIQGPRCCIHKASRPCRAMQLLPKRSASRFLLTSKAHHYLSAGSLVTSSIGKPSPSTLSIGPGATEARAAHRMEPQPEPKTALRHKRPASPTSMTLGNLQYHSGPIEYSPQRYATLAVWTLTSCSLPRSGSAVGRRCRHRECAPNRRYGA